LQDISEKGLFSNLWANYAQDYISAIAPPKTVL